MYSKEIQKAQMYLRNLQYLFMEIKDEEICLQLHNVMISSQKKSWNQQILY